MIKPNMATMLGFVATDAGIAQPMLDKLVKEAADASFNCITVDGDTSTNDSFVMIATGQSGAALRLGQPMPAGPRSGRPSSPLPSNWRRPSSATARARPSSSPWPCEGGKTVEECRQVGYAIGHSPLVKTAFFASDPNLGRILACRGLRRHRRSGCRWRQGLARRRAGGRKWWSCSGLPGRGWCPRDGAGRDHGACQPRVAAMLWPRSMTCDFS